MKHIVKPCDFDYNTYKQIIEDLIKEYPFLKAQIIGRTALGRGIFSLSVGNNKNTVVYVGAVKGCDRLTSLILLRFTERLCHSVKYNHLLCSVDIKKAFSQLGVTLIPCLNPDGTEISVHGSKGARNMKNFVSSFTDRDCLSWKANAMGTDINLNFSPCFREAKQYAQEKGISVPSPALFCGEYPESEAETRTFTRLCRIVSFRQCLSLHLSGEEIACSPAENIPVQSSMMAKILACSCNYSLREDDKTFSPYGLRDWFTNEFSRPAFEMGIGKEEKIPAENLYSLYEQLEEALTLFALM